MIGWVLVWTRSRWARAAREVTGELPLADRPIKLNQASEPECPQTPGRNLTLSSGSASLMYAIEASGQPPSATDVSSRGSERFTAGPRARVDGVPPWPVHRPLRRRSAEASGGTAIRPGA